MQHRPDPYPRSGHPKRIKLLAGKIVALAAFTLFASTVTVLVVVLLARPLARLEGIEVEAWKTDFVSHLLRGYFSFTVVVPFWGLIGLMLALLTRSSALANGIGIGYLLVVESLISIVASHASPYLPGGTVNALVTFGAGGRARLAWGSASLAVLAKVAIAFCPGREKAPIPGPSNSGAGFEPATSGL